MAGAVRRFKSVGENIFLIMSKLVENDNICKLLYYTTKAPLSGAKLTESERLKLINTNILAVPKIPEKDNIRGSYIITLYDNFTINRTNTEFKDVQLLFMIVCPPEDWVVDEGSLRPFLIMNEIDEMFNEKKLANIGVLHFQRAERFVLTPQLSGYIMTYSTYEFN